MFTKSDLTHEGSIEAAQLGLQRINTISRRILIKKMYILGKIMERF